MRSPPPSRRHQTGNGDDNRTVLVRLDSPGLRRHIDSAVLTDGRRAGPKMRVVKILGIDCSPATRLERESLNALTRGDIHKIKGKGCRTSAALQWRLRNKRPITVEYQERTAGGNINLPN